MLYARAARRNSNTHPVGKSTVQVQFAPRTIDIPNQLYDRRCEGCHWQKLFCKAYKFNADPTSITFWCPLIRLSDEATDAEWQQFFDDSKRSRVSFTRSFRFRLDNFEITDINHVIITTKEHDEEAHIVSSLQTSILISST
ncbi:hypothetical protein Clacol_005186 [Clathrus columnatus]|uniref:Uncharacterized protein n=1 Tax=Clathrus columnatus TaxID=1419009 RepID=A0AAV5AB81_9AGAM|nr:hypothetical protein Clacol_005186 [Clathrus columnatus]